MPISLQPSIYVKDIAFRTPLGLFQFRTMPFGLHRAPASFQRLMDRILQDCSDCSAAYLDDVVIFSNICSIYTVSWEESRQLVSP